MWYIKCKVLLYSAIGITSHIYAPNIQIISLLIFCHMNNMKKPNWRYSMWPSIRCTEYNHCLQACRRCPCVMTWVQAIFMAISHWRLFYLWGQTENTFYIMLLRSYFLQLHFVLCLKEQSKLEWFMPNTLFSCDTPYNLHNGYIAVNSNLFYTCSSHRVSPEKGTKSSFFFL